MRLPEAFVRRIEGEIPDWESFLRALELPSPVSVRLNANKKTESYAAAERVGWCESGRYLKERPSFTLDPLFHAGAYYVQEASSMFLEQVVRRYVDGPVRALDLCAAPGGKTTHLLALLPEGSLLVSNEYVRQRAYILAENVSKWGCANIVVTNNSPDDFSRYAGLFDLMVVDAPCSGEGMFRKDAGAIEEWSERGVRECEERQRKILSDVWDVLREGGVCVYSTCTYNPGEDEEMVRWMERELGAEELLIPVEESWGIVRSERGYHFYPHKAKGEGFYLCALRKTRRCAPGRFRTDRRGVLRPTREQSEELSRYLGGDGWCLTSSGDRFFALPELHAEGMTDMVGSMKVMHAGVPFGRWKGKSFIPDAALALSVCLKECSTPVYEVDASTALSYLHKDALNLPPSVDRGIVRICHAGLGLGWVKNLGNRSNSLYPDEWRIRMRIDNRQEK
ncbi:MAG: rRNA cytosine-C5-methyltransferase [Paludibacteraceae bacterium]|nr:rRNA cytosine-C5-methyltransferase [Paludibacteraceae bacterium]